MSVTRLLIVFISAEIDKAFLIVLPLVFFMYLFIEFVFLAAMDSSIWSRMVTVNLPADHENGVKTIVTFENLRDESTACFQMVELYRSVKPKTCEGFNKPPDQPSPVVIFVGMILIAALFLLAFFLKSAFLCSYRFIKNTKNNLRKNAFLLQKNSANTDGGARRESR